MCFVKQPLPGFDQHTSNEEFRMMNACNTLSDKDTSILDPLPKRRHCNKTVQCKIAGPKANKRTQTRFDASRSPTRWPEKAGNSPEVKSKSESLKEVHLKLFQ